MNGSSSVLSGLFAGRYAIERELGRGGSGIVYLARDQQRGHAVAVKVLRPEFAESVSADRFLKEIRLSERLHHPHIVPVLDSGKHERTLFFVLPYMEGGTLRQQMDAEKQLPLNQVVVIIRSVCEALAHAHEKALLHRDVKPENILFTSGQACLADFGIARAFERALGDATTSTSVVRGTPPYMSPEQVTGEEDLDGRSDIYSLGCVLYEMLAGIQPFVGPTPQSVIAQRLTQAPRPLHVYRPSLPRAVEQVVAKALAVSRADRYQTATEFAEALEAASRTTDEELQRVVRKRKRTAITAAAAALGAIALSLFMTRGEPTAASEVIPDGDPRRIAVLYLDALTPATAPSYIAAGITEDLIDRLGGVSALHVISPYGVRAFRGSPIALDSIGRALKVGTIVAGSVARSGNTMRVHVRLVDAATGRQINSHAIEEPWNELFALQDKLVNQVAFVLRQRIGNEIALREHRSATNSYEAWETVQRASAETQRAIAASRRNDPEAAHLYLRADSLYARAEQQDPDWILPTIRRGRLAIAMGSASQSTAPPNPNDAAAYNILTRDQQRLWWNRRALAYAESAVRRAPRSADALSLRGDANYELFTRLATENDSVVLLIERDLQSAVDVRPDAAGAWSTLAQLWYIQGRFGEAAAAAQRAFDADAFFEVRRTVSTAFSASLYAERFDDARRWCRFSLEHYPGGLLTDCELTILGWTGQSRRDVAAAWSLVDAAEPRQVAIAPGNLWAWAYRRNMVAAVLARAGLRDSARNVLSRLQEQQRNDPNRRISPLGEAYVSLLLGDRDGALLHLRNYLSAASAARRQVAQHPWFRTLHGDPRFDALVRPAR
jgi:serine/threonine protein kinase/tetratricopeptide (TPR) repeat protein